MKGFLAALVVFACLFAADVCSAANPHCRCEPCQCVSCDCNVSVDAATQRRILAANTDYSTNGLTGRLTDLNRSVPARYPVRSYKVRDNGPWYVLGQPLRNFVRFFTQFGC